MADRPLLGEVLVRGGLIDELQLARALGEQRRWGGRLGLALLRLGFVTEEQLLGTLSRQLGISAVRLGSKRVPSDVLELLPHELAEKYRCLPLFVKREAGRELLHLGMEDPTDLAAIDDVSFRTGRRVRPVLIGPDELRRALARFYGGIGESSPDEGLGHPIPEAPLESDDTAPEQAAGALQEPAPEPEADESEAPEPEADFEAPEPEADADPSSPFVSEETLASGLDAAAEESGMFPTGLLSSSPEADASPEPEPAPSAFADRDAVDEDFEASLDAAFEPYAEGLPSPEPEADEPSTPENPAALDASDLLSSEEIDVDYEPGEDAAGEAGASAPERAFQGFAGAPEEKPFPPQDPDSCAELLPLEDEEEAGGEAAADDALAVQPDLEGSNGACEAGDGLARAAAAEMEAGELSVPEAGAEIAELDLEAPAPKPEAADEAADRDPAGEPPEDEAAGPDPDATSEVWRSEALSDATQSDVRLDEGTTISTRDVLRALTELLVEKEVLEPSELLDRVRALRAGSRRH